MEESVKLCKFESDPNLAIIYSFVLSYGNVIGFDITFEEFEQFINSFNKVNSKLLNLIVSLLKRWKSSSTLDNFNRQILKFAEIFCFDIYDDLSENGFEKSSPNTKLIIIRALCEVQFDSNKKLKEKILTCSAEDMRLAPSGKDLDGQLYWSFIDNELNLRIFKESDQWSLVVKSRKDLLDLIGKLQDDLANPKTITEIKVESDSNFKVSEVELNSKHSNGIPNSINKITSFDSAAEVHNKSECKLNIETEIPSNLSPNCDIKCNVKMNGLTVCDGHKENKAAFEILLNGADVSKKIDSLETPPKYNQSGKRKHIELSPTIDETYSDLDNSQSDISSSDSAPPSDKSADAPPFKRKREKILINRAKRNRKRSDILDIKLLDQAKQIILQNSEPKEANIKYEENGDTIYKNDNIVFDKVLITSDMSAPISKIDNVNIVTNTTFEIKPEEIKSELINSEIDTNILLKTNLISHFDDSNKTDLIKEVLALEYNEKPINIKSLDSICNIKNKITENNHSTEHYATTENNDVGILPVDNIAYTNIDKNPNLLVSNCDSTNSNNCISNNGGSSTNNDNFIKIQIVTNNLSDEYEDKLKTSVDIIKVVKKIDQNVISNESVEDFNSLGNCDQEIISNCDKKVDTNLVDEQRIIYSNESEQIESCPLDIIAEKSQIKNTILRCALNIQTEILEQNSTSNKKDKLNEINSNDNVELINSLDKNGSEKLKVVNHSVCTYNKLIDDSNKNNGSDETEPVTIYNHCDDKSEAMDNIQTKTIHVYKDLDINYRDDNLNSRDSSVFIECKDKLNSKYVDKTKVCSRKRSLNANQMTLESKRKNSSSEQINQMFELSIANANFLEEDTTCNKLSLLNVVSCDQNKGKIILNKHDELFNNDHNSNTNLSAEQSYDSNKCVICLNGCITCDCSIKTDDPLFRYSESLEGNNIPINEQIDEKTNNITISNLANIKSELTINNDQSKQENLYTDQLQLPNQNGNNIELLNKNQSRIACNVLEIEKIRKDSNKNETFANEESNTDLYKDQIEENSSTNINKLLVKLESCNYLNDDTTNNKETDKTEGDRVISYNGNVVVALIDDVIITLNNDETVPNNNDLGAEKEESSNLADAKIKPKGRPRKRKTEIHILEGESSLDRLNFEPRRSSRANKGQRLIDSSLVSFNKKSNKPIISDSNDEDASDKENEKAPVGRKKRRNKKDEDFLPPTEVSTKKLKGRHRSKGKKSNVSSSDDQDYNQDFYDDDFDDLEYEEDEPIRYSCGSSSEVESTGSLYVPHGRNAIRSAAIFAKEIEVADEKPCHACQKKNNPEMILLCDRCDDGYHMTCLKPLLHFVPDGEWLCPTCQHVMLIDKLKECLADFDKREKENCRIVQRKQRLAFVGISLTNILQKRNDEKRAECDKYKISSDEENQIIDTTKTHKQHYRRPKNKYQRKYNRLSRDSLSESEERGSSANESDESTIRINKSGKSRLRFDKSQESMSTYGQSKKTKSNYGMYSNKSRSMYDKSEIQRSDVDNCYSLERSCRQRKTINYKFEEFDELIKQAVGDEHKQRQAEVKEMVSRGKEIDNCLSTNRKKKKNFSQLDSTDSEEEAIDDVDDFNIEEHASTDDEDATDDEVADDDASLSDDEVAMQRRSKWRKGNLTKKKKVPTATLR